MFWKHGHWVGSALPFSESKGLKPTSLFILRGAAEGAPFQIYFDDFPDPVFSVAVFDGSYGDLSGLKLVLR